ncbi:MAG: hypothetical protein IJK63_00375 [Oscillospiraceae bacterium]|nr:hypothetical protein [Oscillospiraceae bacterium]
MSKKITVCKCCGAEIAKTAKTCPKCGAKNKSAVSVKGLAGLLVIIVIICIFAGAGKKGADKLTVNGSANPSDASVDTAKPEEPPVEYTHYDVTELFDALEGNAMKAQNTFKGQYVELEGYLGTIDSDGKYISLEADPENYDYLFQSVHCSITTDEQREIIMELNKGEPIVVRGLITDVGEVMGYYLDIDSIG